MLTDRALSTRLRRPWRSAPDMVDGNRQRELDEMVRSDARARTARDATSPAAARRQLGDTLRDLRKAADLTLSAVASEVQRSTATMSRLERGSATEPREVDVVAMLDVYERTAPGLVSDAIRASVRALVTLSRTSDWFSEYRDVWGTDTSFNLRRLIELETDAESLVSYESDTIPGLLQTEAYARAMAETFRRDDTNTVKERFVRFRMDRQHRFRDRPQHFVIAEAALRRDPGHGNDMHKQLDLLADEIETGRSNVRIQVAPTSLAIPATMGGAFLVLRFRDAADVVYLEHRAGATFLESREDVARYENEFADLTANALDTTGSLALVRTVMSQLDA